MMGEQRETPSHEPSPEERLVRYLEGVDEPGALNEEPRATSEADDGRGSLDAIIEPLALESASQAEKLASVTASRRFGRFELHDELGRGGMGVVYRGTNTGTGRSVAVKMILAGDFASPSALERFRAEARAAAGLQHPGVVTIYDTGEVDGRPFIAMELLEGGSLAAHLPRLGGAPRAAAELIERVARAVDAAHARNILHRDLKPSNIIFDVAANPVVTDFGLARQVGSTTQLTSSGSLLGTLLYMAPEQAKESGRTLTPAADVYSLGAILYEALTGRPPFRGSWAPEMLRQLLYDEPVMPSRREANVPRALDAICLKCLEKSPSRRYQSAGELADDLERYLDGKPIRARAPGPPTRALKWARRRPAAATLAVLVAMLLLAIPVAMLWYNEELRERAADLEARDALSRRYVYAARLNLAYDALARNAYGRVVQLLESLRPREGEEDLRGFGWRHLWRRAHPELHRLLGHEDFIAGIHFLRGGKRLLTTSRDGAAFLWDTTTGRKHRALASGEKLYFVRELSPDSRFLVDSIQTPETRRWEIRARELTIVDDSLSWREAEAFPTTSGVSALAFSPDAERLAVAEGDGTLSMRESKSWSLLGDPVDHEQTIFRLAFSPVGDLLAAADGSGAVFVYDSESLARVDGPHTRGGGVSSIAFSGDGALFACSSAGGRVVVRDTGDWTKRAVLSTGAAEIYCLEFLADGMLAIAARTESPRVELWDVADVRRRQMLEGHTAKVTWVRGSPDGMTLATGGEDHTVKLWDIRTPPEPARHERSGEPYTGVALTPDGRSIVALTRDAVVEVVELESRGRGLATVARGSLEWSGQDRTCEALAPDGSLLALAYPTRGIEVHRLRTEEEPPTSQREAVLPAADSTGSPVVDLEFSHDSRRLVASDAAGTVRIFARSEGSDWHRLDSVETKMVRIEDVALSPDARTLAVVERRAPDVVLWDVASGSRLATLEGHTEWVIALAYTPDSRRLATGGLDENAMLWDVEALRQHGRNPESSPRPIRVFRGHANAITSLAFFPEGDVLASSSDDSTVKLWDLVTAEERATLRGHRGRVNSLLISPDGQTVLSAGGWKREYGAVMVWLAGERE